MRYNIIMQKLQSDLIAKGIILRQENALVGVVEDVVINPDNGQFLGFIVREGFGKKNLKALAEKDMLGFNAQFILIPGYKSLGEISDIVRIKDALDKKIKIIKNKVYTISGVYIGKVADYTIDFDAAKLSRLYVNARSIRRLAKELIIESSCILSIKKDRITVDDTCAKQASKISNLNLGTTKNEPSS